MLRGDVLQADAASGDEVLKEVSMAATHELRLRAGRSIWQARRCPTTAVRSLSRDVRTDVLVVGAGISGALIAEALSAAALQVLVVDRRGPLAGSTPASTALLQYELDTPLMQLSRQIGRDHAERLWRRSRLALGALRDRARFLGIQADQVSRDSLYLSGNVLDRAGLREERDARQRAGFETSFLTQGEVERRFGIRRRTALLSFDNFSADPRKLAAGFLNCALARGTRVYAPVTVTGVEPHKAGVLVQTEGGPTIRCRHLVYATGYELPKGMPTMGNTIASTWVIATRPQPRALWPGNVLIWEASDPYLYLRVTPDQRIICGGEDEQFQDEERRDAKLAGKRKSLERKLLALFPQVDPTAAFAWCGSFGASPSGSPTIGRIPRMPNCYAAMGYGGNGITFSMMAAQVLRGLITERGDPDSDLVSFSRKF